MKYLLILFIFCFTSCNEQSTITVDKTIPTTVSKLAKANTFDTLTVIMDEHSMYVYNRGEYKNTIPVKDFTSISAIFIGIILGMILMLFLHAIFNG